ncbi:hypothetical protein CCP4SC76_2660002 [Gammaproteobacteria bacterium]
MRVILYWNPVVVRVSRVVVLGFRGANLQTCKPIFGGCRYRNPGLMAPLLHGRQEGPIFIYKIRYRSICYVCTTSLL